MTASGSPLGPAAPGSHRVFKRPDGSTYSIPVHHGKVKPFYVREIKRQIGEA
jgi:predicted RNA binding protein YcfA (HicA-like mRNA interferase family)